MNDYQSNVDKVCEYYMSFGYCKKTIDDSIKCFSSLKCYLDQSGQEYSDQAVASWMFGISNQLVSTQLMNSYKLALVRLSEVYATGRVQTQRIKSKRSYSMRLLYLWRYELDNYFVSLPTELSDKTKEAYRYGCAHFLLYCQDHGIVGINNISYSLITDFYETELTKASAKSKANEDIASFMNYLYLHQRVSYGFTIINHYLGAGKGVFWNQISNEILQKAKLTQTSMESLVPLTEFLFHRDKIMKILVEKQYCRANCSAFKQITDLFYLFMEMNNLQYCVALSWLWYDSMKPFWKSGHYLGIRRNISILEQYFTTGKICFTKAFHRPPTNYDKTPDWCKTSIDAFLSMMKSEGRKPNSITNYRVQLSKFCLFIAAKGLTSFSQLNVEMLKQFNLSDNHSTLMGKNAYNSTIRKFIQFLGEEGTISNPNLFLALSHATAPSERIVEVLSDDETHLLDAAMDKSSDVLSLRDKAVLKLGLEMGIRPVDIANLRIDDIDWDNFTVRFIQEKTNVEVCFIMPPDVVNAVYRYIMNERPETKCRNVFVAKRAPYDKLQPSFCLRTMQQVLPKRDFYITRKTYATSLLRNNVAVDDVISALGQRSRHSIGHYLMLDDERMRFCPISLAEYGINTEGVLIK